MQKQIKSAEERFASYFEISDTMMKMLSPMIDGGNLKYEKKHTELLKIAFLFRAWNLYKSIINLLKNDHWENGLILLRALFELVLNLEDITRNKEVELSQTIRFLKFEKLQKYLEIKYTTEYDIMRGYKGDEVKKILDKLDKSSKTLFSDFYNSKRKKWKPTWNSKTIADMANNSPNEMRKHHYKILYSFMSYFSHSSPMGVMSSITTLNKEFEEVLRLAEHKEEEMLLFVLFFATNWITDILFMCDEVIDNLDVSTIMSIRDKFKEKCAI